MEITREIEVTFEQESLIDMHSILNVLNMLTLELRTVEREIGDVDQVRTVMYRVLQFAAALKDRDSAQCEVQKVNQLISQIREAVALARLRINSREQPLSAETLERAALSIENIIMVLRVRAREIIARADDPFAWVRHPVDELHRSFRLFFEAVQYNSSGAYRIVDEAAEHSDGDYLIQLRIHSPDGEAIGMPAVFQDVVRDLLANARKYTDPGGHIQAELSNDSSLLALKVQDNGIGIPPSEIEGVVVFGRRASNVADRPTRGGGFGLTKAYYVTKRCGGRMWIDSTLNGGTTMEIQIPVPG